MIDNKWRTVVIDKNVTLTYCNNTVVVNGDVVAVIPIEQIHTIIINSLEVKITTYLISMLIESNVKIIFCNDKKLPLCETIPYYGNCLTPKRIEEQFRWEEQIKTKVWSNIVYLKIGMQIKLLRLYGFDASLIEQYQKDIKNADSTNREGQAARIYFNLLFGKTFGRRDDNNINAALNYGYSILSSHISRIIVSHGYHTSIGIMHRGDTNFFNLTYDIIEPFRTLIDRIVFENQNIEFGREYKKILIMVLDSYMYYANKVVKVLDAIDMFVVNVINNMSSKDILFEDMDFIE